jgi:hypothetical protein
MNEIISKLRHCSNRRIFKGHCRSVAYSRRNKPRAQLALRCVLTRRTGYQADKMTRLC